jgi:hypothetical protein
MRCQTISRGLRAAAGAAALLAATSGAAEAQTYSITTHAAGNDGTFNLHNLISWFDSTVTGPYELRITTQFTNPYLDHISPERTDMYAFGASMQLELMVGEERYTAANTEAFVSLTYVRDDNGLPLNVLNYSVSYTPSPMNDYYHVSFGHSLWIAPGLLPFSGLLEPLSLSTPAISRAVFDVYYGYSDDEFNTTLGTARGPAEQFSYRLAAVPEPDAHAMTLLGCAIVAVAARRGRRRLAT